jgi:hypothetical protein
MAIDPVSAVAAQSSGAKVGGSRIVELAPSGGAGAGSPQLEARFHQSLAALRG